MYLSQSLSHIESNKNTFTHSLIQTPTNYPTTSRDYSFALTFSNSNTINVLQLRTVIQINNNSIIQTFTLSPNYLLTQSTYLPLIHIYILTLNYSHTYSTTNRFNHIFKI